VRLLVSYVDSQLLAGTISKGGTRESKHFVLICNTKPPLQQFYVTPLK